MHLISISAFQHTAAAVCAMRVSESDATSEKPVRQRRSQRFANTACTGADRNPESSDRRSAKKRHCQAACDLLTVSEIKNMIADRLGGTGKVISRKAIQNSQCIFSRKGVVITDAGNLVIVIDISRINKAQDTVRTCESNGRPWAYCKIRLRCKRIAEARTVARKHALIG